MIRFTFRLLSMIALSVSVIMAVLDATRSIAASAPVTTALNDSWAFASPSTLAAVTQSAGGGNSAVWRGVVLGLLNLPGFVVFAVVAYLFYLIGRRRNRRSAA